MHAKMENSCPTKTASNRKSRQTDQTFEFPKTYAFIFSKKQKISYSFLQKGFSAFSHFINADAQKPRREVKRKVGPKNMCLLDLFKDLR
jgi:predicted N-acyltransferase